MGGGIVFFGQQRGRGFSVVPLEALIDAGFHVCLIIKAGIAERSVRNAVKAVLGPPYRLLVCRILRLKEESRTIGRVAAKHNIPVLEVKDRVITIPKDLAMIPKEEIEKYNPDLICIASFPQLLKKDIIEIPEYGAINFHPSLLPYYPGASPWFGMVMNNETEWGVTIHYIDEGEDTGDIIYQSRIDYSEKYGGRELYARAVKKGAELMVKAVQDIFNGEVKSYPQPKVEDRRRSPGPKFDDLLITLKPTAEETYHFLNKLLFFVDPIIKWREGYYRIDKMVGYLSGTTGSARGIEKSRSLFSNILECYFDDGLIKLKVTQVQPR